MFPVRPTLFRCIAFVLLGMAWASMAKAEASATGLSSFPLPLSAYQDQGQPLLQRWQLRVQADPFNLVASLIFLLAIVHTFLTPWFRRLSHRLEKQHRAKIIAQNRTAADKPHEDAHDDASFAATAFHFLGEIEVVFGLWALVLGGAILLRGRENGWHDFVQYFGHDLTFTEAIFVVVIMTIAASRPVLMAAEALIRQVARLGFGTVGAWWLALLGFAPLLGSFITEPGAMTVIALLLKKKFYALSPSPAFAYATLGLLFVNVSVGGALTHFSAPPVLMVAAPWQWDTGTMLGNFGWKAALGIVLGTLLYGWIFRKELKAMSAKKKEVAEHKQPLRWRDRTDPLPWWVMLAHVFFLAWTVLMSHYPPLCIGGFLFFLAFAEATRHHQNVLELRGPLLVGFFLAWLVIHGRCQAWWLEPLMSSGLSPLALMLGSALFTSFNDNAAITYLATQIPGLANSAKYAIMAGALAGGGLTVIANAPNPAGQTLLARYFPDGVSPWRLLLGALLPTAILLILFLFLKSPLME